MEAPEQSDKFHTHLHDDTKISRALAAESFDARRPYPPCVCVRKNKGVKFFSFIRFVVCCSLFDVDALL